VPSERAAFGAEGGGKKQKKKTKEKEYTNEVHGREREKKALRLKGIMAPTPRKEGREILLAPGTEKRKGSPIRCQIG